MCLSKILHIYAPFLVRKGVRGMVASIPHLLWIPHTRLQQLEERLYRQMPLALSLVPSTLAHAYVNRRAG